MQLKIRRIAIVAASCLIAVCAVRVAQACSCTGPRPTAEAYAAADAVLLAEVVSVEPVEPLLGRLAITARRLWARWRSSGRNVCDWDQGVCDWDRSYRSALVVEMRVLQAFKGPLGARASIYTPSSSGGCGYPFRRGQQYVVYAAYHSFYEEAVLTTHLCTMTREASEAGDAIKELTALASMGKE